MVNDVCVKKDLLGREYDYSKKTYQVLCRSGWCDINYVYRHKTNKPIYRVEDNGLCVDVTEDHSLFDGDKKEIKPTQIKEETKLEINSNDIYSAFNNVEPQDFSQSVDFIILAKMYKNKNIIDRVPLCYLNGSIELKKKFLDIVGDGITLENGYTKTAVAGVNYIRKCVKKSENL